MNGTLVNTGKTVEMTVVPDDPLKPLQIAGTDLPSEYNLAFVNFHWGSEDHEGSEHTLTGKTYPMEMHMVHFNKLYGKQYMDAVAAANGEWDTLAILTFFFEIAEEDNKDMDVFFEALKSIKDQESKAGFKNFTLTSFFPKNTNEFYRYNGSLTQPDCYEIVIWSLFKASAIFNREFVCFNDLSSS